MSKYINKRLEQMKAYTPGEQPVNDSFIKLNTNESPFLPSPLSVEMATEAAKKLNLYPKLECTELRKEFANQYKILPEQVIATNGSDEALFFAFSAFCENGVAFPDITYGFYKVYADLLEIESTVIPLNDDFTINVENYINIGKTVFIANPNAPTGLFLELSQIERILKSNPNNVIVVDEAYVEFGADSCIHLINKYNNLLITRTFSKSHSFAGARLGFCIGCKELINDINKIKYSTNPYNVNSMTMAAGLGMLMDYDYVKENCRKIVFSRDYTISELKRLGFVVTESKANFVFAKHPDYSGMTINELLRENGILVRHFDNERINDYNRITIGTLDQMKSVINVLENKIGG